VHEALRIVLYVVLAVAVFGLRYSFDRYAKNKRAKATAGFLTRNIFEGWNRRNRP
jgi:hypothetical protein